MFDLDAIFTPTGLDEALSLFEQYPEATPIAGGQNLLKKRQPIDSKLISLAEIPSLRGVWRDDHNNLVIGATTTFSDLLCDELIKTLVPAISDTVNGIGNVAFRNRATVGGNLCKGDSFCELAAAFRAYEAFVQVQGSQGPRLINIADFYDKNSRCVVNKGELVTAVIIQNESLEHMFGSTTSYSTHNTPNKNMLFCSANVSLSPDRVRIERLRIAFCAENYPSCRLSEAEILAEGSGIFPKDITPITAAILHSVPVGKNDGEDHEFLVHLIREQSKLAISKCIDLAKK